METQTETLCKHPACKCTRPADGDYCSEYCERADQTGAPDMICRCGHPECSV